MSCTSAPSGQKGLFASVTNSNRKNWWCKRSLNSRKCCQRREI